MSYTFIAKTTKVMAGDSFKNPRKRFGFAYKLHRTVTYKSVSYIKGIIVAVPGYYNEFLF